MVDLSILNIDDMLNEGRIKINDNFSSLSDAIDVLEGTPSLSDGGSWDASLNSPDLVSGSFAAGNFFRVSVAGSTTLDGVSDWSVGDLAIKTDLGWLKIDQSERVESVNGQVGVIELTSDDVEEGLTNEYYTDGKVQGVIDTYVDSAFVNTLTVDANTLNGNLSSDFATSAQGGLADTAVQPGDDATVLGSGSETFANQVLASDGSEGTVWVALTTDEVAEGLNEYYTDGKVTSVVTQGYVNDLNVDAATLDGEGLASFVLQTDVGTAEGVASLDVNGLVPLSQLPTGVATSVSSVATIIERDALIVESGDVAVVAETGLTYIYDGSSWVEVTAASDVTSVNGDVGDVVLDTVDLNDVNVGTLSTGEVLRWDGTEWVNFAIGLGDLENVNNSSLISGNVIYWDGTEWINQDLSTTDLSDITVSSVNIDDVLVWSGSSWENANINTIAATSEDLNSLNSSIVTYVSSVFGDVNEIDGVGEVILTIDGLADVNVGSPTAGQVIAWDGVDSWDATTLTLGDSSDVNIGTLSGGEILQYDSGTSEWVPVSPAYLVASDVDTIAELNNIVADANLLSIQDIDSLAELNSVVGVTLVQDSDINTLSALNTFIGATLVDNTHTHTITDITDFDTHTHTTADFTDFSLTSLTINDFLQWDGTDWVNTTISSTDIQNFSTEVQTVVDETYVSGLDVTANVLEETAESISTASSTLTLDLSTGNVFQVTLNQDITDVTFAGVATSGKVSRITIELIQDSVTGGWSVTWPTSVTWAGGTPPTLSTAQEAVDIVELYTTDNGATWRGYPLGLNFS